MFRGRDHDTRDELYVASVICNTNLNRSWLNLLADAPSVPFFRLSCKLRRRIYDLAIEDIESLPHENGFVQIALILQNKRSHTTLHNLRHTSSRVSSELGPILKRRLKQTSAHVADVRSVMIKRLDCPDGPKRRSLRLCSWTWIWKYAFATNRSAPLALHTLSEYLRWVLRREIWITRVMISLRECNRQESIGLCCSTLESTAPNEQLLMCIENLPEFLRLGKNSRLLSEL